MQPNSSGEGTPTMFGDAQLLDALLDPAHYQYNELALWHFGAAAITLACGALVLYWERGGKVSRLFAFFTVLFTAWAVARGVTRLMPDPEAQLVVWRFIYALVMLGAPLLYQFVVVMVRADQKRVALARFNWVVGAILTFAALFTNSVVGGLREYSWGFEAMLGPAGWVYIGWIGIMLVLVSADVVRALRDAPAGASERRRLAIFTAAYTFLYLGFVD